MPRISHELTTQYGYTENWSREFGTPNSKHSVFKKAINSYNQSMKDENYPLAFLISGSLLEDRIRACYFMIEWRDRCVRFLGDDKGKIDWRTEEWSERLKPKPNEIFSVSLDTILKRMVENGSISNLRRKRKTGWILDIRELLSSLSMWNSDRYDKEICTKLFQEFRYYDKVLRQIKSIG